MFLTPEETGGPRVFSLRRHNRYLAVDVGNRRVQEFDIEQLAEALDWSAGTTWQEHEMVILVACRGGKLFEWLDKTGGE